MNYLEKVYLNWFSLGLMIGLLPYVILTIQISGSVGLELPTLAFPWIINLLIRYGAEEVK